MSLRWRAGITSLIALAGLPQVSGPAPSGPEPPADVETAFTTLDSLQVGGWIDSSLVLIDSWIPIARERPDSTLLLGLLYRQGAYWAAMGRAREAEPVLREARGLAQALNDTLSLCGCVRWLGVAVGIQGRREEGRALTERLLTLSRAYGSRRYEAWAIMGLAGRAKAEGRPGDAAVLYREAVEAFEEVGDRSEQSWSLNNLGIALANQGDYRGAMECYGQAAALARSVPHPEVESFAVNNLGTLEFSLGDPSAALEHFERALELQRGIGGHAAIVPTQNIAFCQSYLGRHADAADCLEQLLVTCRREHYRNYEASTLKRLAAVRAAQRRHHEAAALYRGAMKIDQMSFKHRLEALVGLSSQLAVLDSSEAAIDMLEANAPRFREAEDPLLRLQLARETGERLESVGRCEEALAHLRPADGEALRLGLSEHRVGALITMAQCYRATGQPDSALTVLEEAATAWECYRSLPLDPEWRELRSSESRYLYTDLATLMLGAGVVVPLERIRGAFDRLQRFKARTLLERMLGPGRALDDALRSEETRPVTLAELQDQVLGPDEVLLDFFVGSRTSLLFMVSREACRVVRLPPERELEPQIRLYHELISAPAPADPAADGEIVASVGMAISRLLFGEIVPALPEQGRLVIAPDGVLNLIPFASLPLDGETAKHPPSLIDRWECVRVPSATILARQHERRANGTESEDARVLAVAATETDRGEPLPGAVREVQHLARRYTGVVTRVGADASLPDTVELVGYDAIHLATHTTLDDQRPWQSAICFTSSRETHLRAEEIASMRLPARLAVLSSCQSAGGRILSGEGVLGLSSAFMSAGVPAVVATLWPVDDRTTSRFMERFYAELARGQAVRTALRQAQLGSRGDARTARPFHWAGFVVVGDAATGLPLHARSSIPWTPVIGVVLLMAIGLSLMRHRRGHRGAGRSLSR